MEERIGRRVQSEMGGCAFFVVHIKYVSYCSAYAYYPLHTHTHTHIHSITERVVMPLGSPPLRSFGEDEDEEPDGGSPHRIYDKVEDDPESPYEYVIHCNFNKLIGTACSIGVGLW